MGRDFPMVKTPLGIVAAVLNRGICPHVTFLPRLQATFLVGEGHDMNRGDRGSKTLLVKSGQGLSQRRKAAKVRTGDGVYQQSLGDSVGKVPPSSGNAGSYLPQAGVWHRQTPT